MVKLGIIAEDNTDIQTLLAFIKRITSAKFKKKLHSCKGCGKIKNKGRKQIDRWLSSEGVTHIIICHDLDSNEQVKLKKLHKNLSEMIKPFSKHSENMCIVIPIEEIEAWFLADTDLLNNKFKGMKLKKIYHPETVKKPKEHIIQASKKHSKPRYIPKNDNPKLAQKADISLIKNKCPQFDKFYQFVSGIAL